jgi:hypothetical protein
VLKNSPTITSRRFSRNEISLPLSSSNHRCVARAWRIRILPTKMAVGVFQRNRAKPEATIFKHELLLSADSRRSRADDRLAQIDRQRPLVAADPFDLPRAAV